MDTAHNFFLLNCSRTNNDFEKDKNKTKQINKQTNINAFSYKIDLSKNKRFSNKYAHF
jgi:hypothetical protein